MLDSSDSSFYYSRPFHVSETKPLLYKQEIEFLFHSSSIFHSNNCSLLADAINAVLDMHFHHLKFVSSLLKEGYLNSNTK